MPGEVAAAAQPLPAKPAPFARQVLTEDMLTNRTPEAHQWALEQFRTFRSEGQFVPLERGQGDGDFPGLRRRRGVGRLGVRPGDRTAVRECQRPGVDSSLAESGSGHFRRRQLYLTQCAVCHGDDLAGAPPQIPSLADLAAGARPQEIGAVIRQGGGRMPAFPNLPRAAVDGHRAVSC